MDNTLFSWFLVTHLLSPFTLTPIPVVVSEASYCWELPGHPWRWGLLKMFQHIFHGVHGLMRTHTRMLHHTENQAAPLAACLHLPSWAVSGRLLPSQIVCAWGTLWSLLKEVLKPARTRQALLWQQENSQVISILMNSLQQAPFGNFKPQEPRLRRRILSEPPKHPPCSFLISVDF